MGLFKHFMIEGLTVVALGLMFGQASCGAPVKPKPTHAVTQQPTDENGQKIEKPIPTGCVGKIKNRKYQPDSNDFLITYYTDEKCSQTASETITLEQDLNATCSEGDYFDQCLRPDETEPPGMRLPTDNGG